MSPPRCALRIYAGPKARRHIQQSSLRAHDIGLIAAAAGGPKGLVLGPLDQFIFGSWMSDATHPVHLVGASIGAWRMATAAMQDPVQAFERFQAAYICQHTDPGPKRKLPPPALTSQGLAQTLDAYFAGHIERILEHPRYRLHVVATHGRGMLQRESRWRTPVGYLGLALTNLASRRALGLWAQRAVFSAPGEPLPVDLTDLPHVHVALSARNFGPAMLASCSIPFMLTAVHDIPDAPRGAYWDGGVTDYHLHWRYDSMRRLSATAHTGQFVLYPHFQRNLVPGWMDKALKRRHRATAHLDNVIVLAPDPAWIATLPHGKLPDRDDFVRYRHDLPTRIQLWIRAVRESQRLADEWAQWLNAGCPADRVEAL